MEKELCKRSFRTDWDDLACFRLPDVPVLFPRGSACIPTETRPITLIQPKKFFQGQEGLEAPSSLLRSRQAGFAKHPVGRPRATIKREQVIRLRIQGSSWRQIAKALGIGTATAMRLIRLSDEARPYTQNLRPKTAEEIT